MFPIGRQEIQPRNEICPQRDILSDLRSVLPMCSGLSVFSTPDPRRLIVWVCLHFIPCSCAPPLPFFLISIPRVLVRCPSPSPAIISAPTTRFAFNDESGTRDTDNQQHHWSCDHRMGIVVTVCPSTAWSRVLLSSHMRDSFFGMICIQTWAYYQRYPNDSTSYKLLVRRSDALSPDVG